MKLSNEWVRQPDLDKMLDRLVDEKTWDPARQAICRAAKILQVEANSSFYSKARDWKKRREAEANQPVLEVSPKVLEAFKSAIDEFAEKATDSFCHGMRSFNGDVERAANLRIASANQRAEHAEEEVDLLISNWNAADGEVRALTKRITELEAALADAGRREEHLKGRLHERGGLLDPDRKGTAEEPAKNTAAVTSAVPEETMPTVASKAIDAALPARATSPVQGESGAPAASLASKGEGPTVKSFSHDEASPTMFDRPAEGGEPTAERAASRTEVANGKGTV